MRIAARYNGPPGSANHRCTATCSPQPASTNNTCMTDVAAAAAPNSAAPSRRVTSGVTPAAATSCSTHVAR